MIRPILTIPQHQEFLRQRALRVHEFPDESLSVLKDLNDTWPTVEAYGIAAPQIGEKLRVFIYRPHDDTAHEPTVLFNPKILRAEGNLVDYDGCLSIPGIYGTTCRAEMVEITAFDAQGHKIRQRFEGFTARIIQHEMDHLDGVLFIDRVERLETLYTLQPVEPSENEPSPNHTQVRDVPLNADLLAFIQRHRRPLPAYALSW